MIKSETRKFTSIIHSGKKSPNFTKREDHHFIIMNKPIKLSPKIEPKFKGKVPTSDSKGTMYKEREFSDIRKSKP